MKNKNKKQKIKMKNEKTETKMETKKMEKGKFFKKVQSGNITHSSTAPKISYHLLWLTSYN